MLACFQRDHHCLVRQVSVTLSLLNIKIISIIINRIKPTWNSCFVNLPVFKHVYTILLFKKVTFVYLKCIFFTFHASKCSTTLRTTCFTLWDRSEHDLSLNRLWPALWRLRVQSTKTTALCIVLVLRFGLCSSHCPFLSRERCSIVFSFNIPGAFAHCGTFTFLSV